MALTLATRQPTSVDSNAVYGICSVKSHFNASLNASMSFYVAVRDTTAHENAWGAYAVGGSAVRGW